MGLLVVLASFRQSTSLDPLDSPSDVSGVGVPPPSVFCFLTFVGGASLYDSRIVVRAAG